MNKLVRQKRNVQEAIDWLNRVINESILGSSLIRILYSQHIEYQKFMVANAEARDIGLSILSIMSAMIPVITLAINLATVIILALGGHFVIFGTMSLGDFTAFNTYLSILVFPIIILGFMSNVIAMATASNVCGKWLARRCQRGLCTACAKGQRRLRYTRTRPIAVLCRRRS